MPQNPYICGPIVSGKQFFGREGELQQLSARIIEQTIPLSCSIVGETRIGKSSLLKAFQELIEQEKRTDLLVLSYDMSSDFSNLASPSKEGSGAADFYRNFISIISADLRERNISALDYVEAEKAANPKLTSSFMTLHIKNFFRSVRRAGYWLVLILDEFDSTTGHFKFDPAGWKLLRALGSDQSYALCYLFASRRPISILEQDAGISSNLAGIFETIRIGLMPENEVLDLINTPIEHLDGCWTPEQQHLIMQTGGNHPYCLQLICAYLFHLQKRGGFPVSLDERGLISNLRTKYQDLFTSHRKRLESNGKNNLFEVLLKLAHSVPANADERQIDELIDLGHLCNMEGTRYTFRPFSLALDYYLQSSGQDQKLWPLIEETEAGLRKIVERRYRARFGENWLSEIQQRNSGMQRRSRSYPDMVTRWEKMQASITTNPFVVTGMDQHLIQAASMSDLKQLISQQPELFQSIFPWQKRELLDNCLMKLSAVHSPDTRYKRLRDDDVALTETYCQELLAIIRPYIDQDSSLPFSGQVQDELPQIGQEIQGNYKIVDEIGRTKHSYVVKAWDMTLNRFVAIKFLLNTALIQEEADMQRNNLEREGKVLAQLNHPNLGTVFAALSDPPGVVMPWIEEGTLSLQKKLLFNDEADDLPLPILLSISIKLANGLDALHTKGITHRDIKPNNILITERYEPILIDYDIARSNSLETITKDSEGKYRYVGNAAYSSPEQFVTPSSLTFPADIFSLGVVMFQAITGQLPFPYNNPLHYPDEHLPTPPVLDLPQPLYEILCAMLKEQPKERPEAAELEKRLRACCALLGAEYNFR